MRLALLLAAMGTLIRAEIWTAADESRRIAQLKQEETRAFEMQMRGQNPFAGNPSSIYSNGHVGYTPHYGYDPYVGPVNVERKVPTTFRSLPQRSQQSPSNLDLQPASVDVKTTNNWCFTCMSPWSSVGAEMQRAIQNLLDIRRGKYPNKEFITSDCSQPRNISALKKQDCAMSYCQTLILTDHNTASSFTIRGCAEKLGAVDDSMLEKRGDNTCKKLHDSVDLQECICKSRKFCYTGPQRRNLGYSEQSDAVFLAPQARSSAASTNLISLAIILYMMLFSF